MDQRLELPIIFVHMFKAGGTSLRQVIRNQFRGARVFEFLGDFEGANAWRARPQSERDGFDLLIGHQHYGHHEFLTRPATYMTMLRDPVERVLSYYYYVKRYKSHNAYKLGFTDETTIEEFVFEGPYIQLDNIQTRLLNPQPETQYPFGSIDEKMFETALANLGSIHRVGVVERMEDFMELLRMAEGWSIPHVPMQNRTADRPESERHSEAVIERIKELNRFDIRLYQAACERFECDWAQCQSAARG